jgi:tetratricopeptide (TPR) repeat protein
MTAATAAALEAKKCWLKCLGFAPWSIEELLAGSQDGSRGILRIEGLAAGIQDKGRAMHGTVVRHHVLLASTVLVLCCLVVGTTHGAPSDGRLTATAKRPQISRARRQAYLKHLVRGRAAARSKRWADAVEAFEAALVVRPLDALALGELGWAAFQSGDFKKARVANSKAVLTAMRPEVKAAALYNLGRTAEAQGDKADAVEFYARSLRLRPNAAVVQRLAGLGMPASPDSAAGIVPAAVASDCDNRPPDKVCACLEAWAKKRHQHPQPQRIACATRLRGERVRGIELVVEQENHFGTTYYFLLAQQASGWRLLGELGRSEHYGNGPGDTGSMLDERVSVGPFEFVALGRERILRVTTGHEHREADNLGDLPQLVESVATTVCVVPRQPRRPVTCPLQLPTRVGRAELEHEIFHVKLVFMLDVRLNADGTAQVVLVSGRKTPALAPLLRTHRLW